MIPLLIIADDFTGALDTGVQLSASGARTLVVTDTRLQRISPGTDVLVLDAETRHLPPQQAADVVSKIVARARELGVSHLYKKTDSALRGNIGAELGAVLSASGERRLVFFLLFRVWGDAPWMEYSTFGMSLLQRAFSGKIHLNRLSGLE